MKSQRKIASPVGEPEKQLKSFIDKFTPEHQKLIRAVRKALRRRLPAAQELVYDNYNFFVIGYGPTERPSDCLFSMAAASSSSAPCRPGSGPAGRRHDRDGRGHCVVFHGPGGRSTGSSLDRIEMTLRAGSNVSGPGRKPRGDRKSTRLNSS